MKNRTASSLATSAVASGVLMAAYLLLRPYGDVQGENREVDAMASSLWMASHTLGMLALASFASLVLRLSGLSEGWIGMVGRWSAMTGLVMVLPYYGAETFALHVIAQRSGSVLPPWPWSTSQSRYATANVVRGVTARFETPSPSL